MSLSRKVSARLLLASAGLCPLAVSAQDSPLPTAQPVIPYDLSVASVGVNERRREEYESPGAQALGGTFYPSLQVIGGYTDNVFGTREGEVSDAFVSARPVLEFRAGEGPRSFSVRGAADVRRYFDSSRADETALSLDADASVPIGAATVLQSGVLARRAYERPASGSFPLEALARIEFDEFATYVRVIRGGSRLRFLAALDASRFDFKDAHPAFGGPPISQDDRDRAAYRGSARIEWALSGAVSAFVEGAYSQFDYRRPLRFDGTENVDGSRWEARTGVLLTSGKLRGGLGVGYAQRTYDASRYDNFSGLSADVSLQYLVTGLTTLSVTGRRTIEEGGAANAGSFIHNQAEVRADHELLRNLILSLTGQYAESDYRTADRNDTVLSGSGSARYLLSRHLELTSELGFVDRASSGLLPGPEFNALYGALGVTFRF